MVTPGYVSPLSSPPPGPTRMCRDPMSWYQEDRGGLGHPITHTNAPQPRQGDRDKDIPTAPGSCCPMEMCAPVPLTCPLMSPHLHPHFAPMSPCPCPVTPPVPTLAYPHVPHVTTLSLCVPISLLCTPVSPSNVPPCPHPLSSLCPPMSPSPCSVSPRAPNPHSLSPPVPMSPFSVPT